MSALTEYQVPSAGIRPGDIITGYGKRNIKITDVTEARVSYRGRRFPVRYLTGVSLKTQQVVMYTAAHGGFWIVTRAN